MKKRHWLGVGLSVTYGILYAVAATSAEPLGVLFIDGINTLIVTAVEEITGMYNMGMIPFPVNFVLGLVEWFAIGAYLLPGIGKLFAWIFCRKKHVGSTPSNQ